MNDKFKRAFYGKSMTQKQIAKWERTRSKGMARYSALYALFYGTSMAIGMPLTMYYLDGQPGSAKSILVSALFYYLVGFLMGLFLWSATEKRYRESLNAK
jgi:hypothetical protein